MMKQPTISYEDKKLKVSAINWGERGYIDHVCFYDNDGEFQIAFQCWKSDYEGREDGILYLDLIDRVEDGE